MEIAFAVKGLVFIGLWVAVLFVLLGCPKTPDRFWLLLFAGLTLTASLGFAVTPLFGRYFGVRPFYLLFHLVSLAAAACMLAHVLVKKRESGNSVQQHTAAAPAVAAADTAADRSHPLYGVKGWLKFFVVVGLYVAPTVFILSQLLAWTFNIMRAEDYPGLVAVGLVDTGVGSYLVYRGIQVARGLRDLQPRAVQNTKTFLLLCLAWNMVSIPLSFLTGLEIKVLLPGVLKIFVGGIISFALWYSYFNTSRRVSLTYPDCRA